MNHLKTISNDAMSVLRTIIKLNVADVKEIYYYNTNGDWGGEGGERGGNVKTAILVEI